MEAKLAGILSLDSLKIGYTSGRLKKVLLPPINASASKGELIAVIGKNGIGKSTLLRTIAGLQQPIDGKILYSGKSISEYTRIELAQIVGYISTEIIKVNNMKVYDLVSIGRFPHTNWLGKIDKRNHNAIMDALEKTGISDFRNRSVAELSDGERQRTMIARILTQDAGLMVMDEPTAFLDIGSKYEILHLLHLLSNNNGKTIIFSTHDLHMAVSQADKIWLIVDNELIEGAPEDLMIQGAFDHLFDSSPVKFNSDNGIFSFRSEEKGSIHLEGEGVLKHWTEKAINRIGFTVSPIMTIPYITLPSGDNKMWQLCSLDTSHEFVSIYELIRWLNTEQIRPI